MSYAMVHLEVAYRLLNKYDWIVKKGDFMLGAVAPDAVHFHDEYKVSLKEQSHLWDCGPKWGVTLYSDRWKGNILKFWEEHKGDENRDFIAGYCVHILTDWLNDLRIWSPFKKENMEGDNVEEIYHIYGQEAYGSDQWLFWHGDNSGEIWKLLPEGQPFTIPGCIMKEDIERQKKYILIEQYKDREQVDISGYHYCTKDIMCAFMDECVEVIAELLHL